jgi:phage shock protein C
MNLPEWTPMEAPKPRLRRSRDKIIAGVCGGIAEWLGWDPTVVRILYVVVSLVSAAFPGLIVYLVLWFVMPKPE